MPTEWLRRVPEPPTEDPWAIGQTSISYSSPPARNRPGTRPSYQTRARGLDPIAFENKQIIQCLPQHMLCVATLCVHSVLQYRTKVTSTSSLRRAPELQAADRWANRPNLHQLWLAVCVTATLYLHSVLQYATELTSTSWLWRAPELQAADRWAIGQTCVSYGSPPARSRPGTRPGPRTGPNSI